MTIQIANVEMTGTFGHWLARTNQLAEAMSEFTVTVGGNPAVGDAVVHGSISANTARIDAVTGFSGDSVNIESTNLFIANTASVTTIGEVNINGNMNVGSVSTIKIAGSNTTHQVLAAVDANGKMGFIKVEFPIDQLTDVDTTNAAKDTETILKWNPAIEQWQANTLSLINSTRINTLNVGTITSDLVVTSSAKVSNTLFVNASNKRVGIGTNTPLAALSVNGSIIATGDIAGFQTSDATFKDIIGKLDPKEALEKLMQVEVTEFFWKEEEVAKSEFVSHLNSGKDTGVIAQNFRKLFPEMVAERPDGTLAVNYAKLIPYLVAAIQRLNEK